MPTEQTRACSICGGSTESGQLGTLEDPQLFFAAGQTSELGGMRMVRATGERMAVDAERCTQCGHIELRARR